MALEKSREFIGEHKKEVVITSVLGILGGIAVLAADKLRHPLDDPEQSAGVPDPNDS